MSVIRNTNIMCYSQCLLSYVITNHIQLTANKMKKPDWTIFLVSQPLTKGCEQFIKDIDTMFNECMTDILCNN